MRTIFTLLMLFLTFNLFCQEMNYSENSEVGVVYSDKPNKFHSNQKPSGIFVNEKFIGNQEVMGYLNDDKIDSIRVEKEKFEV